MNIKYVHTNIIAKDWEKLTQFYINVFGCVPLLPKRDLSGEWIEKMTGINGVRLRGIHLALPGYEDGPTLEIFQYEPENQKPNNPEINMYGFAHLAFHVDNVEEILNRLIENGGSSGGEIITREFPELGFLTAVYAKDPEGNFIELQNWKR